MNPLSNITAIVTGAARGQGAAHAQALVARGASVVIGDVLHAEGRAIAERLGDAAVYVDLDVTEPGAWQRAVATARRQFGGLTALVNNAGTVGTTAPILELPLAAFQNPLTVNLGGAFLGIQTAAPEIAANGGGSIVNVSSINGYLGAPGIAGYVASKFALRGLTRVAALELAPLGIRVNAVVPGAVDTPMIQPAAWNGFDMRPDAARMSPLGRIAQPDEIAELVVWLVSPASSYCTGSDFVIDGGLMAGMVSRPDQSSESERA